MTPLNAVLFRWRFNAVRLFATADFIPNRSLFSVFNFVPHFHVALRNIFGTFSMPPFRFLSSIELRLNFHNGIAGRVAGSENQHWMQWSALYRSAIPLSLLAC
jgi:hypothetical protein